MNEKCKHCKFFEYKFDKTAQVPSSILGKCKRYPPQIDDGRTKFPVVNVEMWCGEFKNE